MWSAGWLQGLLACLVTYVALHTGIFWADHCRSQFAFVLSESLRILAPSPPALLGFGVYTHVGKYGVRGVFSTKFLSVWRCQVGGCMQGWFPLAGLPRIPPWYSWSARQAPCKPVRHQFPSSFIGDEFKCTFKIIISNGDHSCLYHNFVL